MLPELILLFFLSAGFMRGVCLKQKNILTLNIFEYSRTVYLAQNHFLSQSGETVVKHIKTKKPPNKPGHICIIIILLKSTCFQCKYVSLDDSIISDHMSSSHSEISLLVATHQTDKDPRGQSKLDLTGPTFFILFQRAPFVENTEFCTLNVITF